MNHSTPGMCISHVSYLVFQWSCLLTSSSLNHSTRGMCIVPQVCVYIHMCVCASLKLSRYSVGYGPHMAFLLVVLWMMSWAMSCSSMVLIWLFEPWSPLNLESYQHIYIYIYICTSAINIYMYVYICYQHIYIYICTSLKLSTNRFAWILCTVSLGR